MTELSTRRLLAPLAAMVLSTLSCSVLGPGPLPPLANTVAYGPELPDVFPLPATTMSVRPLASQITGTA